MKLLSVQVDGANAYCVVLDGQLVLTDTTEGCNEQWPAERVAESLGKILGLKVETITWKPPARIDWDWPDMLADLATLDAMLTGGKKKKGI